MAGTYAYEVDQLVWSYRDLENVGGNRLNWTGPWAIGSNSDFSGRGWWTVKSLFAIVKPDQFQTRGEFIRPFNRDAIAEHKWEISYLIFDQGPYGSFIEIRGPAGPESTINPPVSAAARPSPRGRHQLGRPFNVGERNPSSPGITGPTSFNDQRQIRPERRGSRARVPTSKILEAQEMALARARTRTAPMGETRALKTNETREECLPTTSASDPSNIRVTIHQLESPTNEEVHEWAAQVVEDYFPTTPAQVVEPTIPPLSLDTLKNWFQVPNWEGHSRGSAYGLTSDTSRVQVQVEGKNISAVIDVRIIPTIMSRYCLGQLPAFLFPGVLPVNFGKEAIPEGTIVTYVEITNQCNQTVSTCHHPVLIAETLQEECLVLGTFYLRGNLVPGFEDYYQCSGNVPSVTTLHDGHAQRVDH